MPSADFQDFFAKATGKPPRPAPAATAPEATQPEPAPMPEHPVQPGQIPLTPEEQTLVAALVEDGLSIQDRFQQEPIYRDTGCGHLESRTVDDIQAAKLRTPI
jgi:hypothetical protein